MDNLKMNEATTDATYLSATIMPKEIPIITAKTTFSELLAILGLEPWQKRPQSTPKKASLLAMSGKPIIDMSGIRVFPSGYALYVNRFGKYSVVWLAYCTRFIYKFNGLTDAEKLYLDDKKVLSYDDLVALPWLSVIALFGEERITRKIDKGFGCKSITDSQETDEDPVIIEQEDVDLEGRNFTWGDEPLGVDPLNAVIRRETRDALLNVFTDDQREVFVLYYRNGWTQRRIADYLGIDRSSVKSRLYLAKKKAKIFFRDATKTPF